MSTLHSPATDIQGRADPLINPERFGSNRRAHDVYHRIHRADFMKMNSLDRSVVNLRFGRAQCLKDANRSSLNLTADRSLVDYLPNLLQPATMRMLVLVWSGRPRPRAPLTWFVVLRANRRVIVLMSMRVVV